MKLKSLLKSNLAACEADIQITESFGNVVIYRLCPCLLNNSAVVSTIVYFMNYSPNFKLRGRILCIVFKSLGTSDCPLSNISSATGQLCDLGQVT
jgi:hypothetical protein